MQQFKDLYKKILAEGHDHEDRTGVGRRSITGPQLRFNLQEGFPLLTLRNISFEKTLHELLWFISGSKDISYLKSKNVPFWDKFAVKKENIAAFVDEYFDVREDSPDTPDVIRNSVVDEMSNNWVDQIGPMYGYAWRFAEVLGGFKGAPLVPFEYIPSDFVKAASADYINQLEATRTKHLQEKPDVDFEEEWKDKIPPLQVYAQHSFNQVYDQLGRLVYGLKTNPWTARHVVSAWLPQYIPYETLSPEHNVLMGKGALAPCHMSFQCVAEPPKEGSDRNQLSMILTIRSSDTAIGLPSNVSMYATLLEVLASVCGYERHELIVNLGDAHLYLDQIDLVKELIERESLPLPTIDISPLLNDVFDFDETAIVLKDYQAHPGMSFNVAK